MSKISLNKSIEARKLNQRSGLPMTGPEVTIPYGAIIEHTGTDRGTAKFRYLGEPYSCRHEVLVDALDANALEPKAPAAPAAPVEQTAPREPVTVPSQAKLQWEPLDSSHYALLRAKVPGGWLVALAGASVAFYPDPEHLWDGSSVA